MKEYHIRLDEKQVLFLEHLMASESMLNSFTDAVRYCIDSTLNRQDELVTGQEAVSENQLELITEMLAIGFSKVLSNQIDEHPVFEKDGKKTYIYDDAAKNIDERIHRNTLSASRRRLRGDS